METYEKYIRTPNISFKYAKGESVRQGREIHPFHEIIFFMGENAFLFSETAKTEIKSNTLIVIPKDTYHQLNVIGDPRSYIRCVLNFHDDPELVDFINRGMPEFYITEATSETVFLFNILIKAADAPCRNNGALLKAVLTVMLSEIKKDTSYERSSSALNPIVLKCISYVTENIGQKLCVSDIAKHLTVSRSSLSHAFTNAMNISLHQYILRKRLAMAYEKIEKGTPSTVAAFECGFKEYSNFYRQYKKAFGFPPSAKKK